MTVEIWILEHDKTLNTSTWLEYEEACHCHVAMLKCKVCTQFVNNIRDSRNFNAAFIEGLANLRTSSFTDHAKSDMHQRAMLILKKETSIHTCTCTFETTLQLPDLCSPWIE